MKVVKIDEQMKTVLVSYTVDEFIKEVSRASILMNLYKEYKFLSGKPDDGQLKLDLDNSSSFSCSEGDITDITEKVVQEVLSKEEEKKRKKEEKKKREEELGKTDPRYGFKKQGLEIIAFLYAKWGKNMVDVDSDEFKIFRIKNKIKDIGYMTVILKKLYDRGFCEIYYKGTIRPQISQFKFKF